MASFHPGVKALLERIAKQQPKESQNNKENLKDAKISCEKSNKSSKLTLFKENLKQRMKEKRERLRKEEEEEDQLDEEYHFSTDRHLNDEDTKDSSDKNDESDEASEADEDEEEGDETEDDKSEKSGNESEDELKLKLDNDDDDDDEDRFKVANKKTSGFPLQTQMSQIPASIPSNQLTSNSSITIIRHNDDEINDDFSTTQPKFRLFMETQEENPNKTRLDELESLSFNCGDNTANSSTLEIGTNKSGTEKILISNDCELVPQTDENTEELFDELAFLCSGKFKEPSQKQDDKNDNDDALPQINATASECDSKEIKEKKTSDLDDIFTAVDESDDERVPEIVEDNIEETNDSDDKQINDVDESSSESVDKKPKSFNDFFEAEAELSGEDDGDENDEESDDEELVCSGDEDDLPSDSEIKDRLNQIYLKDQMDQEKKKLRLLQEMYLQDGDMHQSKGHRKKNFRWKNIDDERGGNPFNHSDEESEDEEDDDENERKEPEINIEKSKKFKSLNASSDWRTNRHEREAFHEKEKKKWNSDDENDQDSHQPFIDENSSSSSSNFMIKSSGNQFLKIGQSLLQMNNKKRKIDEIKVDQEASVKNDKSKQQLNEPAEKCSILKKNKTYLNRLSNYVNKTLVKQDGKSAASVKINKNAMVFASVSYDEVKTEVKNEVDSIKQTNDVHVEEPKVKKQKLTQNTTESIFNLL